MDANKLKQLREMKYEISRCCFLCEHSNFNSHTDWGVCEKHEYVHLKHTGPKRYVSITKYGCCGDFVAAAGIHAALGAHLEFFTGEKK